METTSQHNEHHASAIQHPVLAQQEVVNEGQHVTLPEHVEVVNSDSSGNNEETVPETQHSQEPIL
ncbi:hypothetical protein A2U01_0088163, partial [Trifolium medium]|nr:hypothetical protein [Trifolium medium]